MSSILVGSTKCDSERVAFFYFATIFQKGIDKSGICAIINKVERDLRSVNKAFIFKEIYYGTFGWESCYYHGR